MAMHACMMNQQQHFENIILKWLRMQIFGQKWTGRRHSPFTEFTIHRIHNANGARWDRHTIHDHFNVTRCPCAAACRLWIRFAFSIHFAWRFACCWSQILEFDSCSGTCTLRQATLDMAWLPLAADGCQCVCVCVCACKVSCSTSERECFIVLRWWQWCALAFIVVAVSIVHFDFGHKSLRLLPIFVRFGMHSQIVFDWVACYVWANNFERTRNSFGHQHQIRLAGARASVDRSFRLCVCVSVNAIVCAWELNTEHPAQQKLSKKKRENICNGWCTVHSAHRYTHSPVIYYFICIFGQIVLPNNWKLVMNGIHMVFKVFLRTKKKLA